MILRPQLAAPADGVLALARDTADPDVGELDDPHVLTRWGLRPSSVVSRDRVITQQWARAILDTGDHAGVAWWSYRDPRWASYGLWDRTGVALAEDPEPLTLTHPAVLGAAGVIGRIIEVRDPSDSGAGWEAASPSPR